MLFPLYQQRLELFAQKGALHGFRYLVKMRDQGVFFFNAGVLSERNHIDMLPGQQRTNVFGVDSQTVFRRDCDHHRQDVSQMGFCRQRHSAVSDSV